MKLVSMLLLFTVLLFTGCEDDPTLVLEPSVSEYEIEAAGGEFTIEVKANLEYAVKIPDEAAVWLSLVSTRTEEDIELLTFNAMANTAGEPRETEVGLIAASNSLEQCIRVTQKAVRVVNIEEKTYTLAAEGETVLVAVTTNTDYTVTIPAEATWLTRVEARSEMHNETLAFLAERNADGQERSAEVILTAEPNIKRHIVFTQPSVAIPQAQVVWMEGESSNLSDCLIKAVSTREFPGGGTVIDLGTEATANCYVVQAAAEDRTYRFPANVRGNGPQGIAAMNNGNAVSGSLQLGGGVTVRGDASISEELAGSFIYFTVSAGRKGNAVITVYGSDAAAGALWTWHIWVVDAADDPTETSKLQVYKFTADNIPTATDPSKWLLTEEQWTAIGDVEAMDRNLGAERANPGENSADVLLTTGLAYCWGFNVPFPGALHSVNGSPTLNQIWSLKQGALEAEAVTERFTGDENSSVCHSMDLKEAIAHPDRGCSLVGEAYYNLWGQHTPLSYTNYYGDTRNPGYISLDYTHKSIFDPCPAGYCLPPQYLYFGFQTTYTKFNNGKAATANAANLETLKEDGGFWFYIQGRGTGEKAWYPLNGYYGSGTGSYSSIGSNGSQWTSAPDYGSTTYGANFYFSASVCCPPTNNARYLGYAVRCVKER